MTLDIKNMSAKEMKELVNKELEEQIKDPKKFASTIKLIYSPNKRAIIAKYSLTNALLLLRQNKNISDLKTFKGWEREGAQVLKGQKALYAFAPIKSCNNKEHAKNPKLCPDNCQDKYVAFRKIALFDISQTSKAMDLVKNDQSPEALNDYRKLLHYLNEQKPFDYEEYVASSQTEAMGKSWMMGNIANISVACNQENKNLALTLLHEFGHYSLEHLTDLKGYQGHVRGVKETEAEMYAMISGSMLGISNDADIDNQAAYITSWSKQTNEDKPLKVFEHVASVLRQDFKPLLDQVTNQTTVEKNQSEQVSSNQINHSIEPQE